MPTPFDAICDAAFGPILAAFGKPIVYDPRGTGANIVTLNAAVTFGLQVETSKNVIGSAQIRMSDIPLPPLDSDEITIGGKLYQVVLFDYDGVGGDPADQFANKIGTCTVYFRYVKDVV
jgi:hypothetical protein